jgi:phage tail sheath protein FI
MPATLTFPGVYIQELPSGVHPITGVPTSIGAFVGWAAQGPTDQAVLVQSFQDFQRVYGGLDPRSNLGYAVMHFFLNGGPETYVLRVARFPQSDGEQAPVPDGFATVATLPNPIEGWLNIKARNEGKWGNPYWISVRVNNDANSKPVSFQLKVQFQDPNDPTKTAPDPNDATKTITTVKLIDVETFDQLTAMPGDPRYVLDVLQAGSNYVIAEVADPKKQGLLQKSHDSTTDTPDTPDKPSNWHLGKGADGEVITPDNANSNDFFTALAPSARGETNTAPNALTALTAIDIFNILCVPGLTDPTTISNLQALCQKKRAFMIVDCSASDTVDSLNKNGPPSSILAMPAARYSAFFFPRIMAPDPIRKNQIYQYPACGAIAGIFARTDSDRGVWKAPAGTLAGITGIQGLQVVINDDQNGLLNPKGINCLRTFPVYGNVVWGARTLAGNDELGDDYKYIPVRRLTNFIEESLFRGTKWVVFELNDEPLWAQIRLNVGAFMNTLFRQGAFQGASARDAYLVKCDSTTTTQNDINRGVVNIVVGFAPLKPAEFVVITIQQLAGQIAT